VVNTAAETFRLLLSDHRPYEAFSHIKRPLFAAISEARHDLVRLLLELGADIGHRNVDGAGAAVFLVQRTRMRMLSEEEMLPIVQTLLAAGVDPTAPTPSGQTAGDLARDHGCSAIAALLNAA
jgi:ankyrin repeat protein